MLSCSTSSNNCLINTSILSQYYLQQIENYFPWCLPFFFPFILSIYLSLYPISCTVSLFTVPKFAISQSEANFTVPISYDIKSLNWFCYRNAKFWAEFGYGKYLIVPFWYASAAYQARLISPWVFWLDSVSTKHEPWIDQTRLICRRSVPKRYD